MSKYIAIFLIFMLPLVANAGGPSWKVVAVKLEMNGNVATFELYNQDEIYNSFQECNPLKVTLTSEGEPWYQLDKTWSKFATLAEHKKALSTLRQYVANRKEFEFGYIGSGIIPMNNNQMCSVTSKRLMLHSDGDILGFNGPT